MQSAEMVPTREVKVIDLVARDHQAFALLPALQGAVERWARDAEAILTAQFRSPWRTTPDPVEIVPGGQLRDIVNMPRFVYTLSGGGGLIAVDDLLGCAYILRQFGGDVEAVVPSERPPTATERRTVIRLAQQLVVSLKRRLEPICTIDEHVDAAPPELAEGVAMALIAVRVQLGEMSGSITVALSTAATNFHGASDEPPATAPQRNEAVRAELDRTQVQISSILGSREISLGRFLGLNVGDVLTLDTPVEGEVMVMVEGKAKFMAKPTLSRGSLGLEIKRLIRSE